MNKSFDLLVASLAAPSRRVARVLVLVPAATAAVAAARDEAESLVKYLKEAGFVVEARTVVPLLWSEAAVAETTAALARFVPDAVCFGMPDLDEVWRDTVLVFAESARRAGLAGGLWGRGACREREARGGVLAGTPASVVEVALVQPSVAEAGVRSLDDHAVPAAGWWSLAHASLAQGVSPLFAALARAHRRPVPLTPPSVRPVPAVSVIVRSMNRPELVDALWSVAAQTMPVAEVIVVNAAGGDHPLPDAASFPFMLRRVDAGQPLKRAAAANAGLEAACGDYVLLLDDDDLILSDHVAKLAAALSAGPQRAAYGDVTMVGADGMQLSVFDADWDVDRLRGANFLPIHAVMFARSLLEHGCRFDESFDCLEDWDFWLQIAEQTGFVRVPGVSAVYRYGLGLSALSGAGNEAVHLSARARLFEKWKNRCDANEWVKAFYWFEKAVNHHRARAQFAEAEAHRLGGRAIALTASVATLEAQYFDAEQALASSRRTIESLEAHAADLARQKMAAEAYIAEMRSSTSWRLSGPVRLLSRVLRGQWREAGAVLKNRLGLGARADAAERADALAAAPDAVPARAIDATERRAFLTPIALPETLPDGEAPNQYFSHSIAVHLHVHYVELVDEFAHYLQQMPVPFDLYISVTSADGVAKCEQAFAACRMIQQTSIAVVPNRGRDIAPMFCQFGPQLAGYDVIAHLHTKKSLYNGGASQGWREYLLAALLGSPQRVRYVLHCLTRFSIVFPQCFSGAPYFANTWLANRGVATRLAGEMGIGMGELPQGYFDFPVGSMFWARREALAPLFQRHLQWHDFPEEAGQTDGTIAHAIERLFGILASRHRGVAILRDESVPSWSPWRFDQVVTRDREWARRQLADPAVRLIIFDIFDTLLVRPLLDPEDVKRVIAAQLAPEQADAYHRWRMAAESEARHEAGEDVGLEAIYRKMAYLAGWSAEEADAVKQREIAVERAAVGVREDGAALLAEALRTGKRVVLASDMYLSADTISSMLKAARLAGWHALYVSSELGRRKDDGALFAHILQREGVRAEQALMVGDNERSDLQIPDGLGMRYLHVLRPVELARGLPRLMPFIEAHQGRTGLAESLTLGLIVRARFSKVFFDAFDPDTLLASATASALGYGVLGPVVLAFVQWLAVQSRRDGVEKLFFLAREGEFLKLAYDRLTQGRDDVPPSAYLVVSRRAVNVPAIRTREDMDDIAATLFNPAHFGIFLEERFGLSLSAADLDDLAHRAGLPDDGIVTVQDGDLEPVRRVLDLVEAQILNQAAEEREALLDYLNQAGLGAGRRHAVVDVGYAGTIQKQLNRVLPPARIHGYYMMTHAGAGRLAATLGVDVAGCYCHNVGEGEHPPMLQQSFQLEKLLSADSAQVVRYHAAAAEAVPQFKTLSEVEVATRPGRSQVREGALEFIADWLAWTDRLGLQLDVPVDLSRALYEAWVGDLSESERQVLSNFALDDFFCGRGVVV